MSIRPWTLSGLEKKAAKAGYKPGSPSYYDYIDTNKAKAYNSFKVPCIAGYIILGTFAAVVLSIALYRVFRLLVPSGPKRGKVGRLVEKHIVEAPLVGKRHARAHGNGLASVRAPLRGHVILLVGLALLNFIPLMTFYRILDPARNTSWPNDRYAAQSRYVADRAGVIATAQLPLLFLMSGRNNLVCLLTGCSFNTSMLYHRWIARLVVVQVLIHGVTYTSYLVHLHKYAYYWTDEYWFRFGVLACIFFCVTTALSHRGIRKFAYDVFVVAHVVLAIAAIALLKYHIKLTNNAPFHDFIVWTYVASAFWAFDRVVRLIRLLLLNVDLKSMAFSTGSVDLVPNTDVLKVTVQPSGSSAVQRAAVHPGAHFYLYLPRLQPFTSHPFSLAEVKTSDGQRQFVFYSRIHKGITKKLHNKWIGHSTTMLLEGPYGAQHDFSRFDDFLLLASGIGITHCLSMVDGLLKSRPKGRIHLVWCIRSESLVAVAMDILNDMKTQLQQATSSQQVTVTIYIARSSHKHARPLPSESALSEKTHVTPSEEDKDHSPEATALNSPTVDAGLTPTLSKEIDLMSEKDRSQDLRSRLNSMARQEAFQMRFRTGKVNVHELIVTEADRRTAIIACGSDVFLDEVRSASLNVGAAYFEEPFDW